LEALDTDIDAATSSSKQGIDSPAPAPKRAKTSTGLTSGAPTPFDPNSSTEEDTTAHHNSGPTMDIESMTQDDIQEAIYTSLDALSHCDPEGA